MPSPKTPPKPRQPFKAHIDQKTAKRVSKLLAKPQIASHGNLLDRLAAFAERAGFAKSTEYTTPFFHP